MRRGVARGSPLVVVPFLYDLKELSQNDRHDASGFSLNIMLGVSLSPGRDRASRHC